MEVGETDDVGEDALPLSESSSEPEVDAARGSISNCLRMLESEGLDPALRGRWKFEGRRGLLDRPGSSNLVVRGQAARRRAVSALVDGMRVTVTVDGVSVRVQSGI